MPGQDGLAFQGEFIDGYVGAACAWDCVQAIYDLGTGNAGRPYGQSSPSQLIFSALAEKAVISARAMCGSLSSLLPARSRDGTSTAGVF